MLKRILSVVTVLFCMQLHATAQAKPEKFDFKFGSVSKEDFVLPADAIEKDANAFVICDKGYTEFVGNNKGWFSLRFKRKVRIKINNANGVDAADFKIYLYKSGSDIEKVMGLKAVSYNLEGDKIVETNLKSDQVFSDKYSKNRELKKFSVPGVKAGSLIDVTYEIESDFLGNLQPWEFQGEYPCYWSEYFVAFPSFFRYIHLSQGYQQFFYHNVSETRADYNIRVPSNGPMENAAGRMENVRESANVANTTWVMKNVPALKQEPFTSTLSNHIAKIDFQLSQYSFEGMPTQDRMARWSQVVTAYNGAESFGLNLYKNNGWLDDELKGVVAGTKDNTEKAKRIYKHLRDKYTCNSGGEFLTSNLKSVQKLKNGNVGDINLMLVAMLNHEGIKAVPVLLSTKEHGWVHDLYPLMDKYNYVVAQVPLDDKIVYLDATEPGLPFGVLPANCYNGQARIIAGEGPAVYFEADSIVEKKTSTFMLVLNDKKEWVGRFSSALGTYESLELRQRIKRKGIEAERNTITKAIPAEFKITEPGFENLDTSDNNIVVRYDITPVMEEDADVIYINPMLAEAYKDNPFASAERKYPVEMPYAFNEMFVASIQIPEGYVLDDKPKSSRVSLFESDGMFEYLISADDTRVEMRCKLQINKANFVAEEYEVLREFFTYVVKKQAETIVFKKKKA
ncbi:MAG TPA: transglutaminase domain-containing protein [Phnomibacter sp.]|nr:transglutaminase domain-containing protein [Phnomibacter sp.]